MTVIRTNKTYSIFNPFLLKAYSPKKIQTISTTANVLMLIPFFVFVSVFSSFIQSQPFKA